MNATLPTTFPHKVESLSAWSGVVYQNNFTKKTGVSYTGYRLVYQPDGARKVKSFKTIEATMQGVTALVKALGKQKAGEVILSNGAGERYNQAMESLATLPDAPAINIMAADYVAARKVFFNVENPPSMRELADFYAKRRGLNLPPRTVSETVSEMLKVKRAEKLSERHVEDLSNRLARFGKDFQCQIADVDAPKLAAWLRALGLSARSQNNFRTAIQTLMAFAKSCGYLPRDWNELETVPVVKSKNGAVEIFTPDEITKLLAKANAKLLPFLAIGAFAGLRSAEIERLTWDKVNLVGGYITVDAAIAKTNSRRIVPILPNLKKWLKPLAKKEGKVSVYAFVTPQVMELAEIAGVEWKCNGLRHSYASYRLATTSDAAKVSLEMGNSPKIVQAHYRALVTSKQGKAWFGITPDPVKNVVDMPTTRSISPAAQSNGEALTSATGG